MKNAIALTLSLFLFASIYSNDCPDAPELYFGVPLSVDLSGASVTDIDPTNDGSQWVTSWFRLPITAPDEAATIFLDASPDHTLLISVHEDCSDESLLSGCPFGEDMLECVIYWGDWISESNEVVYLRFAQRLGEQDDVVGLSLQSENLGCTSPCDGNYAPEATISDGTCLFWIVPWVRPSNLYDGSPFSLSCGNHISFHSHDTLMGTEFIWRPCYIPDSFAPTTNGLAWGLIQNSGGDVSFRATSTSEGFIAHVYQRELEPFSNED
ncbi:MAG: hypothetical protein AAF193_12330, partial [Bacteroidota bacterium]